MKIDTQKIEKRRFLSGWSKSELARRAGVDQSTVGRVERGETLKPDTIKRIAEALQLTVEDLLIEEKSSKSA